MAQTADHYKKYQVYFFLYLAVICELLIIIVERDDAEAVLLQQQRALEEKNRKIILELLKNMPAVAAAGDNQLKVGESRSFTIRVKGLGDRDNVTTPPTVHVYKDGLEKQTLKFPGDIRDTAQNIVGERLYRFTWKADQGAGRFEFWVEAGTNRIELRPELGKDAQIKVGSLEFSRDEIQKAIDFDPVLKGTPIDAFIRRSESLDPAKFTVDVISESFDQLQIQSDALTTAVGYPTIHEIKVRGTTVDKVTSINILGGGSSMTPKNKDNPFYSEDATRGKWVWSGTFNEPGEKNITAEAYDNRGAGALSHSRPIQFTITVKNPFLVRSKPQGAFAGELFEMNTNVHGLEDVGSYKWSLDIGGQKVESGVGSIVKYKVPADMLGKSMIIHSTYKDRPYQVYTDSTAKNLTISDFMYTIGSPVDRIAAPSFSKKGEYPVSQVFQFMAVRCGRCIPANYRNIQRSEIRIEAETSDGADLFDSDALEVIPQKDPNTGNDRGTLVKFRLKGKVSKDGSEATIKIRFGSVNETYDVTLFKD
jgi:hypothetical protein